MFPIFYMFHSFLHVPNFLHVRFLSTCSKFSTCSIPFYMFQIFYMFHSFLHVPNFLHVPFLSTCSKFSETFLATLFVESEQLRLKVYPLILKKKKINNYRFFGNTFVKNNILQEALLILIESIIFVEKVCISTNPIVCLIGMDTI